MLLTDLLLTDDSKFIEGDIKTTRVSWLSTSNFSMYQRVSKNTLVIEINQNIGTNFFSFGKNTIVTAEMCGAQHSRHRQLSHARPRGQNRESQCTRTESDGSCPQVKLQRKEKSSWATYKMKGFYTTDSDSHKEHLKYTRECVIAQGDTQNISNYCFWTLPFCTILSFCCYIPLCVSISQTAAAPGKQNKAR